MSRDPNAIYLGQSNVIYASVERFIERPNVRLARPQVGYGIKLIPGPGHKGGPLLFSDRGAAQLEQIIHRLRDGTS